MNILYILLACTGGQKETGPVPDAPTTTAPTTPQGSTETGAPVDPGPDLTLACDRYPDINVLWTAQTDLYGWPVYGWMYPNVDDAFDMLASTGSSWVSTRALEPTTAWLVTDSPEAVVALHRAQITGEKNGFFLFDDYEERPLPAGSDNPECAEILPGVFELELDDGGWFIELSMATQDWVWMMLLPADET